MNNGWAMRRWQRCGLLIREIASHASGRDLSDLVPIYKSMTIPCGDDDSVKLIQLRYLQDMHDAAEF
jgi:hypothetical protein